MSQDSQPGDYVFFGTPLHSEEADSFRAHEFQKKDVKDVATVKALPVWQQEVVDKEGRQRFHGAFTGGWSAGYYNTAGSAEGWAPAAFKSSRADRGDVRKQAVEDFLDEDELDLARSTTVQINPDFDTFGGTAAELSRRAAAEDAAARPGTIPNLVPEELLMPVADSIGIRLLQAMGWRQGKGVGSARREEVASGTGSKWGRVAGVGPDDVAQYTLKPKDNVHGLGFDPYKEAEEFRDAKRARDGVDDKLQPLPPSKRQRGVAFGSGVVDEDDVYGMVEDYITGSAPKAREVQRSSEYHFELDGSDEEDTGPLLSTRGGRDKEVVQRLMGRAPPLQLTAKNHGKAVGAFIAGFTPAKDSVRLPFYPPPQVPANFVAAHEFPLPPPPTSAPPPSMVVPESTDARFRRDLQQLLTQFAERSRAAAVGAPGQRSTPLATDEGGAHEGVGMFKQPVSQRPGVAGSSAAAAPQSSEPFLAATGVLEASFVKGSQQDMGMGGGLPEQVGLRPGVPRQMLPMPPPLPQHGTVVAAAATGAAAASVPAGISFQSAGTLDQSLPSASLQPVERKAPVRSAKEWRPSPMLCKRLDIMDPYRGRKAVMSVQAPKQGIAGALFDLGSTQQEVAHQQQQEQKRQQGIAARSGSQGQALGALPPPPPRPAQVPDLTSRFASTSLPAAHSNSTAAATVAAAVTAAEADAMGFLDSLELLPPPPPSAAKSRGGQGEGAGSQQNLPASPVGGGAEAAVQHGEAVQPQVLKEPPPIERPMDLFKAIFETGGDDDSEEESEEEDTEIGPTPPAAHEAAEKVFSNESVYPAGVSASRAALIQQEPPVVLSVGTGGDVFTRGQSKGTVVQTGVAVAPVASEWTSTARLSLDAATAAKQAEQEAIMAALARVRRAQKHGKKEKKEKKGKKEKRKHKGDESERNRSKGRGHRGSDLDTDDSDDRSDPGGVAPRVAEKSMKGSKSMHKHKHHKHQ